MSAPIPIQVPIRPLTEDEKWEADCEHDDAFVLNPPPANAHEVIEKLKARKAARAEA